jgi:hypothetical protein
VQAILTSIVTDKDNFFPSLGEDEPINLPVVSYIQRLKTSDVNFYQEGTLGSATESLKWDSIYDRLAMTTFKLPMNLAYPLTSHLQDDST